MAVIIETERSRIIFVRSCLDLYCCVEGDAVPVPETEMKLEQYCFMLFVFPLIVWWEGQSWFELIEYVQSRISVEAIVIISRMRWCILYLEKAMVMFMCVCVISAFVWAVGKAIVPMMGILGSDDWWDEINFKCYGWWTKYVINERIGKRIFPYLLSHIVGGMIQRLA